MQTVDSAYAAAIAAAARSPVGSVTFDWDGTGSTTQVYALLGDDGVQIDVDRSYATNLPEGVGFIEGHAAAQLDLLIVGDTAKALSPFNTGSSLATRPRLGAPVTASIGLEGFPALQQFTGRVRSIGQDSRTAVVSLQALDFAEMLRFEPVVPDVVAHLSVGRGGVEQVQWLNASWIITEVLAQAGIHVAPPPRATAKLYVTLRGSLAPRPGYGTVYQGQRISSGGSRTPPFIPGRSGLALYNVPTGFVSGSGSYLAWQAETGLSDASGQKILIEFWALTPYTGGEGQEVIEVSNAAPFGQTAFVRFGVEAGAAGRPYVFMLRPGNAVAGPVFGPTPTGEARWRYYAVYVTYSTSTATVTLRADGVSTTTTVTVGSGGGPMDYVSAGNYAFPAIQDLQVSNGTLFGVGGYADDNVPGADLATSMLWLDRTPAKADLPDTAWGLLTQIAAAEAATVEFSELGRLVYRTADRWALTGTAGATVDASNALLDLYVNEDVDTVRNRIIVPISNVDRARPNDGSQEGSVYSLASPTTEVLIAAGQTRNIFFQAPVTGPLPNVFSAEWSTPDSPYHSTFVNDSFGTSNANNEIKTESIEWFGSTVMLTVTNTTATAYYLAGGSKMVIVLQPAVRYEANDTASQTLYGERVYTLADSHWRQQAGGAQQLAANLLADLKAPLPILDQIPVVGDPRRQLGDRIRVSDPDGLGVDKDYWVVGIHTTLKDGSLTQTLTLRPCRL